MPAKARQSTPKIEAADIQSPSLVTHLHAQDRELSKVAGSPRAWRKMTELEYAYDHSRLGDKGGRDAIYRLAAGNTYARLWICAQSHTRDSTEAFFFDGGGRGPTLGEAQRAALARLVAIEMHLGARDKIIVRAVCGSNHSPAQAIALAKLCSDTRVTARLCEALDALADAIERTAKSRPR